MKYGLKQSGLRVTMLALAWFFRCSQDQAHTVNGGELDGKRYLSSKTVQFMLSNHIVGMTGSTIATTAPG